jgi:hypothetical protein
MVIYFTEAPSSETPFMGINNLLGTVAATKEYSNFIFTWMDK